MFNVARFTWIFLFTIFVHFECVHTKIGELRFHYLALYFIIIERVTSARPQMNINCAPMLSLRNLYMRLRRYEQCSEERGTGEAIDRGRGAQREEIAINKFCFINCVLRGGITNKLLISTSSAREQSADKD